MNLRSGDWVEVRSKEEILRSLDKRGRLDELPFMPQMFDYCGQRFKVYKRAHKTCDTINPISGRRLNDAVHLDLRCNGKAYGGCQAACLIFWKEAWLKPLRSKRRWSLWPKDRREPRRLDVGGCSEENVWQARCAQDEQGLKYTCQATEVPNFTTPLAWWDVRQYVEDYLSGNVTLRRLFCGFAYVCYFHLFAKRGKKLGAPSRWLYDRFQALIGGVPYPRRKGKIPKDGPTPAIDLNLQPGELVRVKSYSEVLATVDTDWFNRGMAFDAELVPYCGGVYRVQARVSDFINEKNGRMSKMKTPAVILEGVWCRSRYSHCRMFCPRSIHSWWREIWLERMPDQKS